MLTENEAAEIRIRRVVENWALFRDAGRWDALATVWHDDGWMTATWFQGPASDFIRVSRQAFDAGVNILHFLGGFSCDVGGERAIAQTKMTIQQRAPVHGILVDATCTGRFYDFLEKRGGVWALVRRQPIYEKDRLDPVDPAARPPIINPVFGTGGISRCGSACSPSTPGFYGGSDRPELLCFKSVTLRIFGSPC